ncbi:S8 family peptidase [Spirosoma flavum]|uniref:S8 family serine peptidase n=1 Tax=Spirosoma flavum TaxID=2048557 RepID=A0ABW6AGT7_9BACT
MTTESTQLNVDVSNFGKVPVQVKYDPDRNVPIDITHCPPGGGENGRNGTDYDPRLHFKNDRIVPFIDPKNRLPQYAIQRQKVVTLTKSQRDQLLGGTLSVGTLSNKDRPWTELESISRERIKRVIQSDCPDSDLSDNGEELYTVLLDWEEKTSMTFPDLSFRDSTGNITQPISQTNNFLVVSVLDGTNNPPVRPPVTASGPLNTQPSDFRPATPDDIHYYQQYSGKDNGPAVAVLDTGLKYNLLNPNEENQWPDPYMYRDADGQERRFTLAYQDQLNPVCGAVMADNHLGYCALLAYREHDFINNIKSLTTTNLLAPYSSADVMNSPFDDFRLFKDPADESSILDARHGTSVTAIIQQNGDDAPVLPVKAFDNIGFATLFDVLNGLNYIVQRCKSTNIRVVNTSWIFGRDEPLLRRKIEQLMEAGVFVVAAAGNEGQTVDRNLDAVNVYPACYSKTFPNVITVTSVRKTYFPPDLLSPKEDSLVEKALSHAIDFGLFGAVDKVAQLVNTIVPTAGYVAVENYSTTYVNVGVVSTFGFFRSPFWKSPIIRGSSFACAFVSGFVIRQIRTKADLLELVKTGDIAKARQKLLEAMNGGVTDTNLENEYVNGGYYLNGYSVD